MSLGASLGPLLSPAQVAALVGLKERAIYKAVQDGELRAFKLRGRIRVDRADLQDWLERSVL